MTPRSPLPQRRGLDAAWVRTPSVGPGGTPHWATMREFLLERLPARARVAEMLEAGEFVDDAGQVLSGDEPYVPHRFVWFHRELAPETVVPFPLTVLHADERIVVVDKPHFMATTPRGAHVQQTALVRARLALGLPELAPAHRLDRLTAGVLVFTTRRKYRGAYAGVFQSGGTSKTYEAIAAWNPALDLPLTVVGRIEKPRGSLQASLVPGERNSETLVEVDDVRGGVARYRLTPRTGKTHQLRVHLASIGCPIVGDPLYPEVLDVTPDDFSAPLQLVARRLWFTDPIDGSAREFVSSAALDWPTP